MRFPSGCARTSEARGQGLMKTPLTKETFIGFRNLGALACSLLLLGLPVLAVSEKISSPERTITDVKSGREGNNLVITVLSNGPLSHEESLLNNPPRLVFDFPNSENKVPFFNLSVNDAKVKKLRIRQHQAFAPKITRMVVE